MSLWVDKYRPNTLAKLSYHTAMAERLARLVRRVVVEFERN